MTLLILGVLEGGQAWAWASPTSIAVFAAGAVLLVAFVFAERRAVEPVLPLWVLSRRLLLTTSLTSLGVGAVIIGLTSYVPTYLEGAIGSPPLVAGLALAALTLGWPLAATFSGRLLYLKYGFRPTALIGMGLVVVGMVLLVVRAQTPNVAVVAVSCFVVGLGMGLVAAPSLIAAQASVGWAERGVVTGANMFARSIGSAVGVAVFGAVANAVFETSGGPTQPSAVIDAAAAVFLAVLAATVLTLVATLAMPKARAEDPQHDEAQPADA
jgi:MFS family permease